jgi:3-hydroxyisobutyrate dehydrogenase
MTTVAVLGLGLMGSGMASRLLAAGFAVTVWNRSPERARPLVDDGATAAGSPSDAAAHADIVLAMVADDAASRVVWDGDRGALQRARPGAVLVECSTLSPEWVHDLASRAAARGCSFLEAPVTGSRTHAAEGELLFLVGGEASVLETVRPVLAAMGRGVVHLGPVGSGSRLKLINNFVCGVQAAALAEAVALVERSGVPLDTALEVLTTGAPGSPLVRALAQRMADRAYPPSFALELMLKDLSYAIAEAERRGVELTTAAAARRLFAAARDEGHGRADMAAVVEPLREAAARGA